MSMLVKRFALILCVIVFIISCLSLGGCNVQSDDDFIVIVDMLGEEVQVKKNPSKVACVSRSTVDLLIAFGLGDVVDGTHDRIIDGNPWTSEIYPESENFYRYAYEESVETFFEREIDLIFSPEKRLADALRERGLPAATVSLYGQPNFDSWIFYFADLCKQLWGERPGVTEKINAWKSEFQEAIDEVTSVLEENNVEVTQKFYYVRGDRDGRGINYTDTQGCFLQTICKFLKVDFIVFENNRPSTEAILAEDPNIIAIGGTWQAKIYDEIITKPELQTIDAIKNHENGKVFTIPVGFTPFEQISALSPVFIYYMANNIYPQFFTYDINALIKEAYENYFNIVITTEQANYIENGLNINGEALHE